MGESLPLDSGCISTACFLFGSNWILRDKIHTAALEKDERILKINFALFAFA